MSDESAKPFSIRRRATPGALALAKRLGVKSLGDLAKLNDQDIDSLRSCAVGARDLVARMPWAAEVDLSMLEVA